VLFSRYLFKSDRDSCDEMLRGLEGLGGSRTIDTVDATPPDTMGTSTVELVRQLVALRET